MKALLILPARVHVAVFCQDVNFLVVVHTLCKLQPHPVLRPQTLSYILALGGVGRKVPRRARGISQWPRLY